MNHKSERQQIYEHLRKFVEENPLPPTQAMNSHQHRMFHLLNQTGPYELTLEQLYVEMAKPFLLVDCALSQPVRRALNDAVKRGILRHEPKSGLKPECYYSPRSDAQQRAMAARDEQAAKHKSVLDTVLG
ncbi:TPA: hypothetical protein NEF99_001023 [Pseudomonas aeruginosa]|nr:hypothetical protein [Pseudomonas aeruginosa]